jgi:hypothetical protein
MSEYQRLEERIRDLERMIQRVTGESSDINVGSFALKGHTHREGGGNAQAHSDLSGVHANQHHAESHGDGVHTSTYTKPTDAQGGELGGTIATPTVDTVHSGSSHAATQAAAEATAAAALSGHVAVENAHDLEHSDLNTIGADDHHAQSHGNADHTSTFITIGDVPAHPDLATHDALGLATDAELAAHVSAGDPHTGYRLESVAITHAETTGKTATDHVGVLVSTMATGSIAVPTDAMLTQDTRLTLASSARGTFAGTARVCLRNNECNVAQRPKGQEIGTFLLPFGLVAEQRKRVQLNGTARGTLQGELLVTDYAPVSRLVLAGRG